MNTLTDLTSLKLENSDLYCSFLNIRNLSLQQTDHRNEAGPVHEDVFTLTSPASIVRDYGFLNVCEITFFFSFVSLTLVLSFSSKKRDFIPLLTCDF